MTTPCPHCQVAIQIDSSTLAAFAGRNHFNCPACQGLVALPQRPTNVASAHRGINRNLLILGSVALIVLGGIGFFLASQKSGDTNTTVQNIRNEIINNTYFQNLIATGVTTKEDLEAIGDIRPHKDGFIGISASKLDWKEAKALAARTGSVIIDAGSDNELSSWLVKTFTLSSTSPAWIRSREDVGLLTNEGPVALKDADGLRKVLLHWKPAEAEPVEVKTATSGLSADGLIAYYPFNGNAEDASGNDFHAQVNGAKLTEDIAGNANAAYQFDGKSSVILAPVNINPDVAPNLTMVAWARADSDHPIQQLLTHDSAGYCRSLVIDHRGGGVGWSAFCGSGDVLGYEPVTSGKWNFLAVIYEEEKKMVTMFVNGRKMRKQGGTPKSHKTLAIGSRLQPVDCFHGAIDEVRVYNRALNESEIEQHYQAFKGLAAPDDEGQPKPYSGRKLSEMVDPDTAAVWENDEFEDPGKSGFSWAMKNEFKDGRITIDGMGKPSWGASAHQFNDFAVQVVARTSRDKHHGWGVCIYKHPQGEDAQGVEVLLDSEGMLSIVDCRWTPAGRKEIDPVGPVPVAAFKKGEFNTLVAAFSETRKLAVFVNGMEACAPIELPYVLEPAMLQLSSAGGASAPARLEFESFKIFSLAEKK